MGRKDKFKKIIYTLISLFIVAFIFVQSMLPADKSSEESGFVLNALNSITEFLGIGPVFSAHIVRKLAHFTEFALLSAALFCMYRQYFLKLLTVCLITMGTFLSVAVIDECIQLFSDGRACQVSDVIIDSSGGIFALLFMVFVRFLLKLRSNNH